MRPAPGEVLHFSEDRSIREFVPHVASTAAQSEAFVWAVDHERAPDYWFPRDCPRVLTWRAATTTDPDAALCLGPTATRVHTIGSDWLERMRTTALYAYRLPADAFRPIGTPVPYAQVATATVRPLGPALPVGDLFAVHHDAGIELRVVPDLAAYAARVVDTSIGFSVIRLR